MKKRLDILMTERALAPSREKAKAYIMSGSVYVDGQKEDKAGTMFPEEVSIEVRGNTLPYVSRGGLKLEKAMKNFGVSLEGKVCMDVGASTGAITDCMLQNGAVKVYSIDVGYGQLDWKLRNDPRVVCMEKTNIRYVLPEHLEEKADFFLKQGVQTVIITLGADGCYVKTAEWAESFPAEKFQAIDNTGACDAFISALAVYLQKGRSLRQAVRIATFAAGFCITREGVVPSLIDRGSLEAYIAQQAPELLI